MGEAHFGDHCSAVLEGGTVAKGDYDLYSTDELQISRSVFQGLGRGPRSERSAGSHPVVNHRALFNHAALFCIRVFSGAAMYGLS